MGASASIPTDKHIVIVGAGYGGVTLGMSLLKMKANFTLVSPGDSFHHNLATVRAICVPGWAEKSLIPLETTFGAHFKQGKVVEVKPDVRQVVLSTGETLTYDILVIATGTTNLWPFKVVGPERDEVCKQYEGLVQQVKEAKRIGIIGGGATGAELAAEIATAYPDKEVTIVHSSDFLLTKEMTAKGQKRLQDILTNTLHIKLVLGERVEDLADVPTDGPATIRTDKGTEIEVDKVFKSTGLRMNTEAYENGLSDCMDEKTKALKVNEFLEVEGHEGIYALGDCTNVPEHKIAYHAIEQAKVLAKTLHAVTTGGKPVAYKAGKSPMAAVISVGPNIGFGETKGGWAVPSFFLVKMKSGDLMSGQTWRELGQTLPH